MKELTELLEVEGRLFESMRESIEAQKVAMIERNIEAMNEALLRTERLALEIEEVDKKRHEYFNDLKRKYGLSEKSSLEELILRMDDDERDEFVSSVSKFLSAVNHLAAELEGMKEMMEFENSYFEFLMGMLSGTDKGTYTQKGVYGRAKSTGSLNIRW